MSHCDEPASLPSAGLVTTLTLENVPNRIGIDTLPTEILGVIFTECLCSETDLFNPPDPERAPLLLCRINSDWRNVALTSPNLWCTLAVHIEPTPEGPVQVYPNISLIKVSYFNQNELIYM